jgi:hypothetical protein
VRYNDVRLSIDSIELVTIIKFPALFHTLLHISRVFLLIVRNISAVFNQITNRKQGRLFWVRNFKKDWYFQTQVRWHSQHFIWELRPKFKCIDLLCCMPWYVASKRGAIEGPDVCQVAHRPLCHHRGVAHAFKLS